MNTSVDKSKLYDWAKCITTLLVVLAHATVMYSPKGAIPIAKSSAFLTGVTDYIYAFHMPLFVLLSGCVFGYCIEAGKYRKIVPFITNKFKKLMIPYWVIGCIYVAPVVCFLNVTDRGILSYIFDGILLSHNSRHLWYLITLFWIFVIYIMLRPLIVKGTKGLLLTGLIAVALFVIARWVPVSLQLQRACNHQLYFYFGILLNYFYQYFEMICKKCRKILFLLPILLLGVLVYNPGTLLPYLYKAIGTLMVLTIGWCIISMKPSVMETSLFKYLKKNSFGIYLFHPMIIYVLYFYLGKYDILPIVLCLFITIAAIIGSVLLTEVFRILHIQFLIGENKN